MKKRLLIGLSAGIVLLLLCGGGLWLYVQHSTYPPQPEALTALNSTPEVTVTSGKWLIFSPASDPARAGLIFYPGGLVDPRAYAPPAHALAAAGYQVIIVPMPLNLAVLAPDRATRVIAAFPEIEHWAIAGHSLGGTMAARFAANHPGQIAGLVLWAAYPADDTLAGQPLVVTSIFGSHDGLVSREDIDNSRPLLPATTRFVAIKGGNHAQFGWYGPQQGDLPAAISHAGQQAMTVATTLELLTQIH
jgi:hypothetical protein